MNSLQSTVLTSSNEGLFLALDGDDDCGGDDDVDGDDGGGDDDGGDDDAAFKQRLEDLVIGVRTWT